MGFLGNGPKTPSHQLQDLGSAVSPLSGVQGGDPTAERFSTIFITQNGLSCNIVNCGLSCMWTIVQSLGAKTLDVPRATLSYAHVRYTCDGNISTEVEVSATFCSAFMGPNRTDRRKNNTTPALEKEGRILKEQTQITCH